MIRHGLILVAIASGLVMTAPTRAEDDVLTELYGLAVHAYFRGNYTEALEHLNTAIESGSQDPRAYYFRALTHQGLGDDYSATDDFTMGASLEAADSDQYYNVSKALERIQGNRRVAIERLRLKGRVNALRRDKEQRRQRYEQIRKAEPDVTVPVPPEPVLDENTLPERESETEMPAEEPAAPAEPAAEEPAAEEPATEAPAEEPAESAPATDEAADPFAETPADAAPEAPAEAPADAAPEAPAATPAEPPADAPATEESPADAVPSADELPPIEVPEPTAPATP